MKFISGTWVCLLAQLSSQSRLTRTASSFMPWIKCLKAAAPFAPELLTTTSAWSSDVRVALISSSVSERRLLRYKQQNSHGIVLSSAQGRRFHQTCFESVKLRNRKWRDVVKERAYLLRLSGTAPSTNTPKRALLGKLIRDVEDEAKQARLSVQRLF
jgi:hypothetical protein